MFTDIWYEYLALIGEFNKCPEYIINKIYPIDNDVCYNKFNNDFSCIMDNVEK